MKKEDLRITKTKRDLRNAIIILLKDKPFEKVTVSDICEKAMINRMTFYKHFQDKYDLIEHTVVFLIEELFVSVANEQQDKNLYEDAVEFCVALTKKVIEECFEKRVVLKTLLGRNTGIVNDVILKTISKYMELLIKEIDKSKKAKYPVSVITSFMTGGCANLLYHWVVHSNEYEKQKFVDDSTNFVRQLLESGLFFEN